MASGSFSIWDGEFGKSRCAEVVHFTECDRLATVINMTIANEPQWQSIHLQVDAQGALPKAVFMVERDDKTKNGCNIYKV